MPRRILWRLPPEVPPVPTFLDGYKTYIAALGLLGLGCFQISQGDMQHGLASCSQALAAFGLRRAIVTK